MTSAIRLPVLAIVALAGLGLTAPARAQQASMSFFVTSVGGGKGADLGGLAGADAHCQALAKAAGSTETNWHAYLSTQGAGAVNARDRIGAGPWANAKGQVIAANVAELHGDTLEIARLGNRITKSSALTEKGEMAKGVGDSPNEHDILTGSQSDGTAFAGADDRTCGNWTKSSAGAAMVGHHDRQGLNTSPPMLSWNSSHPSRGPDGGCSQNDLKSTGGDGLFYCFAAQ